MHHVACTEDLFIHVSHTLIDRLRSCARSSSSSLLPRDDCQDPDIYPRAKLVSEYGFQSFPSFEALRPSTEAADRGPFTDLSRSRQRHADGEQELVAQMARHFRLPKSWRQRGSATAAAAEAAEAEAEAEGRGDQGGGARGSPEGGTDQMMEEYLHWIYLTQVGR
jgi:beta-mannosidase